MPLLAMIMQLIVTRPIEQAMSFLEALKAQSLACDNVRLMPLIKVVFNHVPWQDDARRFDYVFVSSQNGAMALLNQKCDGLRNLPVLSIGEKAALRLQQAGYRIALIAQDQAEFYQKLTQAVKRGSRILYFHGMPILPEMMRDISDFGYSIEGYCAYRQVREGDLSEIADDLVHKACLFPVFSTFGAKTLRHHLGKPRNNWHIFTLSQAIAQPFFQANYRNLNVAENPNALDLIKLIKTYLKGRELANLTVSSQSVS